MKLYSSSIAAGMLTAIVAIGAVTSPARAETSHRSAMVTTAAGSSSAVASHSSLALEFPDLSVRDFSLDTPPVRAAAAVVPEPPMVHDPALVPLPSAASSGLFVLGLLTLLASRKSILRFIS